jgi:hypothetical protein
MKYFTYELISATNDWIEQSAQDRIDAEGRLDSNIKEYFRELEGLKPRLSRQAWQFFRHGFGQESLHDARLLSLRVGDGLNYTPDGTSPFYLNRQRAAAVVEFLNYEQDFHYVFDLRNVNRVRSELFIDEGLSSKSIGDLYAYELIAIDNGNLQLGFLFATGASIMIQFRKLVFRKNRIKRKYEVGEMYR